MNLPDRKKHVQIAGHLLYLEIRQPSKLEIARGSKLQQGGHLKIPLWWITQQNIRGKTRTVKAGIRSQDLEPAGDFCQAPARLIFRKPRPAFCQLIIEIVSNAIFHDDRILWGESWRCHGW